MKINTDGRWKNFKTRDEVPKKVLASQFDYQSEDISDNYFKFKNTWYGEPSLKGWDGYAGDSYSSGVLIKISRDGEQYKVAYYTT